MSLQCPVCRSFIYEKYRGLEALIVIAGLGVSAFAVMYLSLKLYFIPILFLLVAIAGYMIRFVYIWLHNLRNENIY